MHVRAQRSEEEQHQPHGGGDAQRPDPEKPEQQPRGPGRLEHAEVGQPRAGHAHLLGGRQNEPGLDQVAYGNCGVEAGREHGDGDVRG